MIFTTRSDYGLRAALELAARYGEAPLSPRRIAADGRLPEPFVRKILQDLSAAGIAAARRGRGGDELARQGSPRCGRAGWVRDQVAFVGEVSGAGGEAMMVGTFTTADGTMDEWTAHRPTMRQ